VAAGPVNVSPSSRVGALHVHTTYSHDGLDTPERLAELARERGIRFIGLTDHAEDFDPAVFARFQAHCREASSGGVTLIPGLEFRFDGFPGLHLLALGLTRWITPATPADFVRQADGAAGFIIVAHPLLCGYCVPDDVAAGVHAVEVWNAAYNTRYLPDPRALRLLEGMRRRWPGHVGIAGLDQHDGRNDRETRVILTGDPGADPLAELRAGRFVNAGRTMRFPPREAFGTGALLLLTAVRAGLDLTNAVHERWARLRQERR
jgi:hypothetical protein